jgi:hypothetical protein
LQQPPPTGQHLKKRISQNKAQENKLQATSNKIAKTRNSNKIQVKNPFSKRSEMEHLEKGFH